MAQDDKPESMDNKVDALAAMAGGQDISHEGFNAVEEVPDETGQSDAAAALAAQVDPDSQAASPASPDAGASTTPVIKTTAVSGARKSRANTLQKQRSQVHAEQFKRMMVPILMITGILLVLLGAIVMFMVKGAPAGYSGTGLLNSPRLKQIMVVTSFPLGAILMVGAWLFRADIKRGEAAARREFAKNEASER
jgi:hypothetical protein